VPPAPVNLKTPPLEPKACRPETKKCSSIPPLPLGLTLPSAQTAPAQVPLNVLPSRNKKEKKKEEERNRGVPPSRPGPPDQSPHLGRFLLPHTSAPRPLTPNPDSHRPPF